MGEYEYLLDSINNYILCTEKFGHNHDFKELSFSRGKKNYERLQKRLSTIQLPDPSTFKYLKISLEELKDTLAIILEKVLGKELHNEIQNIISIIELQKIKDPFDSVLAQKRVDDIYIPQRIIMSDKLASIEIVSGAHEAMHYLLLPYSIKEYNRVFNNMHYHELPSILLEYIICYELSHIYENDQLVEKHDIIRTFHNKQQSIEDISTGNIAHITKTKMSNLLLQGYIEYEPHNAFTYIVSDIYSNQLYQYYLESPNKIIEFLTKLIKGETSIEDILNYYNINLNNGSTIENYNLKLNRMENMKL